MARTWQLVISVTFFLAYLSIPLPAFSQSGPPYNPYPTYPDYSCPAGTIPLARFSLDPSTPPTTCDEDRCFNEVIGCGPGNVCTLSRESSIGGFFYERQCQCNPPYVKGNNPGYKGLGTTTSCYIPGQDKCNPNPCQNGGTCTQVRTFLGTTFPVPQQDPNGDIIDFSCQCPSGFIGTTCSLPFTTFPTPVLKNAPPNPPPSGSQGVCGTGDAGSFPTRCWFNNDPQGRYVCCDNQGCNGFAAPDYLFPRCQNYGYVPPNFGVGGSSTPPSTPPSIPPSSPPSGSQGVCGTGAARDFPLRCWYNNDPQGRYVCCDNAGCNGFAPPDNLYPRCQANGYVPQSL